MTNKKDMKDKDLEKKKIEQNRVKNEKEPQTGSYKMHLDSKLEDTATDIYYKTECKLENSNVAVPTKDAVEEAKEWVDDRNKM